MKSKLGNQPVDGSFDVGIAVEKLETFFKTPQATLHTAEDDLDDNAPTALQSTKGRYHSRGLVPWKGEGN